MLSQNNKIVWSMFMMKIIIHYVRFQVSWLVSPRLLLLSNLVVQFGFMMNTVIFFLINEVL